jgi:hypothetical protein
VLLLSDLETMITTVLSIATLFFPFLLFFFYSLAFAFPFFTLFSFHITRRLEFVFITVFSLEGGGGGGGRNKASQGRHNEEHEIIPQHGSNEKHN